LNILTFDLEEWFNINNSTWLPVKEWDTVDSRVLVNTEIILSFLLRNKLRATFFVIGWIAERYPELVKRISDLGHDIGYHSYYHQLPRFQTKKEFEKDLESGIELISLIISKPVEFYRMPNLSLKNSCKWVLDCLIDKNISVSSSVKSHRKFGKNFIPGDPFIFSSEKRKIIEFPVRRIGAWDMSLTYSGGGYFRFLPVKIIKRLMENFEYNMIYLHPNDFDLKHPRDQRIGFLRNELNTINISSTIHKLDYLVDFFSFKSLSMAVDDIDKESLITIEL
jgi:polysaccharide deacetylase family protein (PEP-CTERM system associated)